MVIRSINSVFMRHSRWLFGIFTIVIIISFLGFLTPGQFGVGGCSDPGTIRVGMAFGEPVSYNDLRAAMQSMTLYYRLAYGVNPGQLDQMQAFNMVCLQRAAERRGLVASDTEIAELIRQLPVFQEGGQFDYKKYETVCSNLRREGYDGDMIAAAFRSAVLQNKLMQEMMASVVVTPGEVAEFFRYANEKYEVKIAEFQRDASSKNLKVEAAALADFFKQNRENYTIPVQLTAIIVEFPFDRPEVLKEAAAVDEATVRKFYEDNKAVFARDGKEAPAYDKIRNEVKARCVAERARTAVGRQAQEFARAAYDAVGESDDNQTAFLKLAAAGGLSVIRTGKFAADATAIGDLKEPELVTRLAAVFDSVPVSDAVSGKTAAYVGMVVAREEEAGPSRPYSMEKLCPVLAFYVMENEDAVLNMCIKILVHEGSGHTFAMHAEDREVIRRFAEKIPVSRFLVNTPAALGGIGATTGLFPALTLGCGAVGGSSSSNNISPMDLINIRRVAWNTEETPAKSAPEIARVSPELVELLTQKILEQLG